jgi:23S rRNA (guanosine2251-2'-O)-methyltransferase
MDTHRKSLPTDLFTLYGRQPVLEALRDPGLSCFRLHLARSNRVCDVMREMTSLAQEKGIEIVQHDRLALSRISRNGRQDQGVALDIRVPSLQHWQALLPDIQNGRKMRLLALDNVTNPQNVGMILRSACAGGMDGVIVPEKGCARLDPLVIKASAGTLFKTPLYRCDTLTPTLKSLQQAGAKLALMDARARQTLQAFKTTGTVIYVLGNEHDGVSTQVGNLPHTRLMVPMHNGVESLNVAMTATLIAFQTGQ